MSLNLKAKPGETIRPMTTSRSKLHALSSTLNSPDSGRFERALALECVIQDWPSEFDKIAPQLIQDADSGIRLLAVRGVGRSEMKQVRRALQNQLEAETEQQVVVNLIETIARILSEVEDAEILRRFESSVRNALSSRHSQVRQSAAAAAEILALDGVAPELLKLLNDSSFTVRLTAANALGRVGKPAHLVGLSHAMRRSILPMSRRTYRNAITSIQRRNEPS